MELNFKKQLNLRYILQIGFLFEFDWYWCINIRFWLYSQNETRQTSVNIFTIFVLMIGMFATGIRYLKKEKGLEFNVIMF
jgi:hypothetical protein